MRSFSSIDREEYIYHALMGMNLRSYARVEYEKNGVWYAFRNVIEGSYSAQRESNRVGVYQLLPKVDEYSFTVWNGDNAYTPSMGGAYEDVIVQNRKVRLYVGYRMPEYLAEEKSYALTFDGTLYNAVIDGGSVHGDGTAGGNISAQVDGVFAYTLYGELNYDEGTYSDLGYFLSKPMTLYYLEERIPTLTSLSVTADGETVRVYIRAFNGATWGAWSLLGETSDGTETWTLDDITPSYFQYALVFNDEITNVTGVSVAYRSTSEEWLEGEFYIASPKFNTGLNQHEIEVECANALKRAFDKTITTVNHDPGGANSFLVSDYIKEILGQAGIADNEMDIRETTGAYIRTGMGVASNYVFANTNVREILEYHLEALQILDNPDEAWRLFVRNGKITLDIVPSQDDIDFILDERFHIFDINRDTNYGSQSSVIQVWSNNNTVLDEGEVKTHDSVYTFTVTNHNAVLDLDASAFPTPTYYFVNLRPIITKSTGANITVTELSRNINARTITFDIEVTNGSVTIEVYGGVVEDPVGFLGESAGDGTNQQAGIGLTPEPIVNPAIKTHAEAEELAEHLARYFTTEKRTVEASIVALLFAELNDNFLLWTSRLFLENHFVLNGKNLTHNAAGVRIDVSFVETSAEYDTFTWGSEILWGDAGIWGWDLGYNGIDEYDYENVLRA